jgi:hypothetical protein
MSTINYTYNVIVDRFRQFADGHFQLRRFTHGEISQADLEKEAEWPWLHVKPRAINYAPGTRSFSFEIFISDLPRDKEDKTGYQAESITDCSLIFQDLINEIYLGNMFGSDVVLTRPVNAEPFVEQYTHTLTGVTGIVELSLDYDWSACSIPASWNYNTPTDSPSEANNYLTFIKSITQQGFNVSLVNDEETPGNTYYYGTDAEGVKGWHQLIDITGLTCETLPDCAVIISIVDDIAALQAEIALKANTADLGATAFSNDYDDLDNKPTIPAAQVNSDWNAVSGVAQILNKPTIPAAQVNSDWNSTSGVSQILNKPTLTNGTVTSVGVTAGTGISVSGSPVTSSGSITVTNSAPDQVVALTAGSGIAVTGTYPNFTITNNAPSGGSVTAVTATAPMSSTGGSTPNLSMSSANGTTNGYLLSSDWLIFNGKFNTPTGTTLQYLRGDGSLATFPVIPAQYNPTAGTGISITGAYPNQTISNTAPDQVVALTAGTGIGVTGTYPNFTVSNSAPSSGGTVTSVGLTMPSAFSVASSPVTTSGTLAVTGAGTVSQYVRGDGSLANFPASTGGGASLSYYLNGSVSQGTFGGVAFREMDKTPILGAGTDFTIATNGYIQSFITDANVPNQLEIPAGNWNFETYFSASSSGGTPSFYIELYKWDGATLSLIASNSAAPEGITNGTAIHLYVSAIAVPQTTLAATDRLAIRIYVTHSGRTIKLHTENSHLCQVITTFSTGLTALNGLTAQVQNFATGTSGTDFGISSATSTHTFNLPTASAANRGALSSADWTTFNGKQDLLVSNTNIKTVNSTTLLGSGNIAVEPTITAGTTGQYYRGDKTFQTLDKTAVGLANVDNTSDANKPISTATQTALNAKQDTLTLTTTGTSGAATLTGATLNIPQYSGGGGGGASGIHGYMLMSGTTTYSQLTHVGFTSVNSVTNRMTTYPFIPAKTFTCSSLYMHVLTATAVSPTNVCRILIYSNLNDLPNTKLYESANLPLSTTGQKTAITSFVFTAGTTYWLTLHTGVNTAIYGLTASAMLPLKTTGIAPTNLAFSNVDIASSPTTFPTASFSNANPPFIGITIP